MRSREVFIYPLGGEGRGGEGKGGMARKVYCMQIRMCPRGIASGIASDGRSAEYGGYIYVCIAIWIRMGTW
jgi:hypothetical protein